MTSPRYLLDTNICIYIAKQRPPSLAKRFAQLATGSVGMSLITFGELRYGAIRAYLERAGTPIGNNDLWIAAHALALDVTLVSNNTREFERVPKLKLDNWVEHSISAPSQTSTK
jgi:tRNA(fMet)-specific endonuclease VapC